MDDGRMDRGHMEHGMHKLLFLKIYFTFGRLNVKHVYIV